MLRKLHVLVSVLFLTASGSAYGQTGDESLNAKSFFDNGLKFMEDEDYTSAIAEFEASIALKPFWGSLYNLGLCYHDAQRTAEAYWIFVQLIKEYNADLTPDIRKEVERTSAEIKGKIGRILMDVKPAGATIQVNGKTIGTSPFDDEIPVMPGPTAVRISLAQYEAFEDTITIEAGTRTNLPVVLTKAASHEAEQMKDGPPAPETGPTNDALNPDTVSDPNVSVERPSSEAQSRPPKKPGWLIGGIATSVLGVAGVAVGAVFNKKGVDDKAALEKERTGNEETFNTLYNDTLPRDQALTLVGYIAGGTLLAAGVVMIVVDSLKQRDREAVSSLTETTLTLHPGGINVVF